jgi:hypothetical protein
MAVRPVPPYGYLTTLAAYGSGALLMYGAIAFLLPSLVRAGMSPPLAWFVAGGLVFAVLLLLALIFLYAEGRRTHADIAERVRFRAIDVADAHRLLREDEATLAGAVREGKDNR